ncbi:subtilase family protein [Prauserella shujinwangii]|uniref:Subtilase family protein n=1 Tax=Prauserella shujinwangii TaxID=1453103 RepID=A0A2T0LUN4_9PSEU|nr:S8 family peptidase [Prauserella shujinwangii]PRX47534.1 subtilase family protein [Prauserella shujinwangii]
MLAALVLVAAGSPAATAQGGDQPPAPGTERRAEQHSVTLLTGDRVVTGAEGRRVVRIVPAEGRSDLTFSTYRKEGHQYVVPSDAGTRIAAGVLDEKLFDVTELVRSGFDDAHRATLPLLVTFSGETGPAALENAPGATVGRSLASIDGVAVAADKSSVNRLWTGITTDDARALAGGLEKVWLDARYHAALDQSVPQIGAPEVWDSGYTGEGTTIAVLDSGVDESHPDLAGRQLAQRNFSQSPTIDDRHGHGTHVASIALGSGAASDGTYTGVAHGAEYLDGKVLNDDGNGLLSGIIAGMEWASAERGADIVNMSITSYNAPGVQPMEEAVNTLSADHGTLFVVAAGNEGPGPASIRSPGSARAALTVGAVNDDDELARFSSRGPLPSRRTLKPDLTAPGVAIMAALSSDAPGGDPGEENYSLRSGTSMATPHVAGTAALALQQHPDFSHDQLKRLLTGSTVPSAGLTVFQQGSGRVDAARAATQPLLPGSEEIDFGVQRWPHAGEEPARRTLSYTNMTDSDVTVEFRAEARGPDGEPAPGGLFTTSAPRLTVPAGETAAVTVLGDVTAVDAPGYYTGTIVADTGESTVRTPVAVYREQESYDLTLRHLGADGEPTTHHRTEIVDVDSGEVYSPEGANGTATVRLPVGEYVLHSNITGRTGEPPNEYLLAYPHLTFDGAQTVTLDARRAEPVRVSPPNPEATAVFGEVQYVRTDVDMDIPFGVVTYGGPLDRIHTAHLGPRLSRDQLRSLVNTQWTASSGDEFYGLAWYRYGQVPTGFTRDVGRRDVAKVRVRYGAPEEGVAHAAGAAPSPHGTAGRQGGSTLVDISVPATRTEFYNSGEGTVDWNRYLHMEEVGSPLPLPLGHLYAPPRQYQPPRQYRESFNHAVFSPVLPRTSQPDRWVVRDGNTITIDAPLFGDGAGNWGRSATVPSAYTRLFQGRVLIGQEDDPGRGTFTVPPDEADYRLTTEARRVPAFGLSTRVAATWTFRSARTDEPTRLPLSTVRYFAPLDDRGTAPAGVPFLVPVALQKQASPRLSPAHRLSAEVSYDSGESWSSARVIGNSLLVLRHPEDADTVSLRVSAADADGNTVEETIIDAYRLR